MVQAHLNQTEIDTNNVKLRIKIGASPTPY